MTEQAVDQRILQLEHKVAILTQLAGISVSLNSRVEVRPLLQHIMDVAVRVVDCEAASVLLWNETRGELIFEASTTLDVADDHLIGTSVPMNSIAGLIYHSKQAVQVDDTATHPEHYSQVDEDIAFVTRNLLGVPLTYKDKVIGVLEAINKYQLPWTTDDRNYLSIIAAQAAVAIEGAKHVKRLQDINNELSQLDELRNDFIAIASHELRTPLGVIMGYASFLQEEESESAQLHATKVLESAMKLRTLIDGMVNLSYFKQHQGELHVETTTINTLLQSIYQEMKAAHNIGAPALQIELAEDDQSLDVDSTRLGMALANIIQNAVHFTDDDRRIVLAAMVKRRSIVITVRDNGIGIESDEVERIFDEFYQVEDHMTRVHGGLGIGLSIARAIVLAHHGRIWAESDGLGHGATFYVVLPLDGD